jgi:hypothetical protein
MDYSDALVDLRLIEEASAVARSAAAEFDKHGARLMAAEARLRCARLALAAGDADLARADARAAVDDSRHQRRAAWVARAEVVAVEASAARDGYRPESLRRLRAAAATLARHGLRADAVGAYLLAGRVGLAVGQRGPARRHLATATALAHRQSVVVRPARPGRRGAARAGGRVTGRRAAPVPGRARGSRPAPGRAAVGRDCACWPPATAPNSATWACARCSRRRRPAATPCGCSAGSNAPRAASLLTVQPPVPEVEEDVIALRGVAREIKAARRERGEEPRELLARQSALEARIRRLSWARESGSAARAGSAGVVGPGELRDLLGGATLVEYAPIDDRLLAVVVEPRRARLVEAGPLGAVRTEVDAVLFALRRMLRGGRYAEQARDAARTALAALARLVIEPLGVSRDARWSSSRRVRCCACRGRRSRPRRSAVAPSATFWSRSKRAARAVRAAADPGSGPRVALVAGAGTARRRARGGGAGRRVPGRRGAAAAGQHGGGHRGPGAPHRPRAPGLPRPAALGQPAVLRAGAERRPADAARAVRARRGAAPGGARRVRVGVERGYEGGEVLGFASALLARGTAGVVAAGLPIPDGAGVDAMTALHEGLRAGASLADALFAARTTGRTGRSGRRSSRGAA